MTELLDCPFCGRKANIYQWSTIQEYYISCSGISDGCPGKSDDFYESGKEEAIKAWNRRT